MIAKRNFWSKLKGGVTWGCPQCEEDYMDKIVEEKKAELEAFMGDAL